MRFALHLFRKNEWFVDQRRRLRQNGKGSEKAEFHFEGVLVSFVEYMNKNKEKLHPKPIYIEKQGDFPIEIAIFTAFLAHGSFWNFVSAFL